MQFRLQEPLVILDAVLFQVRFHPGDVDGQAIFRHSGLPRILRGLAWKLSRLGQEAPGQLPDVVPMVALLREGVVLLPHRQLHAAGVDGHGEFVDLVAGVVDIKFFPGVPAVPLQHVGQGVPQYAATGVAHVHGAGGVGGDELHHHPLALSFAAGAVLRPLLLHLGEDLAVPLGPQSKVQKTGAGDVYLLEIAPCQVHVVHNGLGNGPWGHVQGLGPRHSEGGGIVPVSGVFGDLHGGLHLCSAGQHTCCSGPLVRGLGQLSDLSPRGLDHIAHLSYHTLQ